MKLKRLCSFLLALTMTCSLLAVPVYATPSEDKQKALQEQQALEEKKKEASAEVDELQNQLSTLMTKMNELEIQLMEKGQEIVQAEADLEDAQEREKQQYEDMKLRIKYMYETGDSSTVERILASGSISEMLAQAEYVQKVHEYDRDQLQEYANTVKEVQEKKETLEKEQEHLEELQEDYQEQSASMSTLIQEKSAEIENMDELIHKAAQKVAEATEKENAERLAALEKAAKEEAERQQPNNTPSGNTPSDNTPSGNTPSDNTQNNNTSSTPSYNASTGNAVVDRAYSCLGAEYVWGGCAPGAFDCSGLVSYCLTGSYTRLGTTYTFYAWPRVSNPQPGDVCVSWEHTGIYIGGGQMIHAATFGVGVIIGPVQSGMIYVRPW